MNSFRLRHASLLALAVAAGCGSVATDPDAALPADADPCLTTTCECTVATEVADCGPHAVCDTSGPGRTCACVPAYADDGAGNCVFQGAPADPGFRDPAVWTAGGQAVVNAGAIGNIDPGEAVLVRPAMCNYDVVEQSFAMPPFDRADRFKLSVTHIGDDPNFDLFGTEVQIDVGDNWFEAPTSINSYRTDTFCLGPKAYGRAARFLVGTVGAPNCTGNSMATINFDHIAVQPATPTECPDPGGVPNGDFEASSGWTFNLTQGGIGAFAAAAGEASSRGLQIASANRCSEVTATGVIGLPLPSQISNPAIDLYTTGTGGARLAVMLGGRKIAVLPGGGARHARICVPEWAMGTTPSLGFFLQRVSNNTCSVALNTSFILDNITVVSDAACASVTDLTDPGFERVANVNGPSPGWGLTTGLVNDVEGARATIVNNGALARTGTGVLRLSGLNPCVFVGSAGADLTLVAPPVNASGGPALRFFANVTGGTLTDTAVILQGVAQFPRFVLPEGGGYRQHVFCLPRGMAGRRVTVRFSTGDPDGGGCLTPYTEEISYIDDVEIINDPSCTM